MRLFSKLLGVAVASIALVGVASCGKDKDSDDVTTIYAATKGSPSPFITQTESGKLEGYDIEVLNEAFKLLPQYKLDLTVSDSALDQAATGLVNFTVNNWGYNTSRAETYYYSYPYTKTVYTFVTRKGEGFSNFEDAAGKRVQSGTSGAATNAIQTWNKKYPDKKINIDYTETEILKHYQDVVDGVYDFTLDDLPVVNSYKAAYPELFENLEITVIDASNAENIVTATTSHLLFTKVGGSEADKLRKDVSEAIKTLHDNGTLTRLSQEIVGTDLNPTDADYKYLN